MKIILSKGVYKGLFFEYMCLLLIFFSFIRYTERLASITGVICLASSILLWVYYFYAVNYRKKEVVIIVLIFIYTFLVYWFERGSMVMVISYLPVALFLLHREKLKSIFWNIVPLLIIIDLLVAWSNSPNKYILYEGISRNYISIFTIYALAFYIIRCDKNNKNCNLIWIIIMWGIALTAIGRGGIIATSFILILFVIQRFFDKDVSKGVKRYVKITFLFIVLMILIIWVFNNLDYVQIKYFGRFFGVESSVTSSNAERIYIAREYIRKMFASMENFLFGADGHILSLSSDNLHNSFLQTHNMYGLIGVLFLIGGGIKASIYYVKEKKWQLLFFFWGILVRGMTDFCFPSFPMDIIIFYFLLLPIVTKKDNTKD